MNGIIEQVAVDRGTGTVRGEDGKTYQFSRRVLSDCWFHELSAGATVTFDAGRGPFEAVAVRLVRAPGPG